MKLTSCVATQDSGYLIPVVQDFYKNLDIGVKVFEKVRDKYENTGLVHLGRQSNVWIQAKSILKRDQTVFQFSELPRSMVALLYRVVD